jgi:hypothetical protein
MLLSSAGCDMGEVGAAASPMPSQKPVLAGARLLRDLRTQGKATTLPKPIPRVFPSSGFSRMKDGPWAKREPRPPEQTSRRIGRAGFGMPLFHASFSTLSAICSGSLLSTLLSWGVAHQSFYHNLDHTYEFLLENL